MKRNVLALFSLALSLALASALGAACASSGGAVDPVDPGSRAGMPAGEATLVSDFEGMCDAEPPCGAHEARTLEERQACVASAREAAGSPCAAEVLAVTRCGEALLVCAPGGGVDEDASWAAMEEPCAAALEAAASCCEAHPDSVLCESDVEDPEAVEFSHPARGVRAGG